MKKRSVFVFFFVDDIIWAYKKSDLAMAKEAIRGLQQKYNIEVMGEPKWFLGIHILRDRKNRLIYLTQDAYIDKIAHKFNILDGKMPATPIARRNTSLISPSD